MFTINGIEWYLVFVRPESRLLRRSDGSMTLAVTDWNDRTVYVSDAPKGAFLRKIIAHELTHCFCFSFDIHMPIEQEEYMADWISVYGEDLVHVLDSLMRILKWRAA